LQKKITLYLRPYISLNIQANEVCPENYLGLGRRDVFTSEDCYEEVSRNYPVSGKGGNAGKSVCFYPILEY